MTSLSAPSARGPEAAPVRSGRSGRPHHWRAWVPLISGVAAVFLVFHLAGGWFFAGVLHDSALDVEVRRNELDRSYDVEVIDVTDNRITFATDHEEVGRKGVWGVAWEGGYGLLSGPVRITGPHLVRDFTQVDGSPLDHDNLVDLDTRAFPDRPAAVLGTEPLDVAIDGPLGRYDTWLFPGRRATWALLGHGNGLDRLDLGKLLPALTQAGYPVLLVPMRNDPRLPTDPHIENHPAPHRPPHRESPASHRSPHQKTPFPHRSPHRPPDCMPGQLNGTEPAPPLPLAPRPPSRATNQGRLMSHSPAAPPMAQGRLMSPPLPTPTP